MMKRRVIVLTVVLLAGCARADGIARQALGGSSAEGQAPSQVQMPSQDQGASPSAGTKESLPALEWSDGLGVRDLLPDEQGISFFVQDANMQLLRVSPGGRTELGKAPEIGLVAAWHGGLGFAYARKTESGQSYEIVGAGHEGVKVLATAVGYPGAMHFRDQALHFVDAEGWKAVTWSEEVTLQAPLSLGNRSNQKAWCFWGDTAPTCVGGYWDAGRTPDTQVTLVTPGKPTVVIADKGPHPILGGAAFSNDGKVVAVILGSRSAAASEPGRVVVAWLDQDGQIERVKDFPVLASQVAFDAQGRLLLKAVPQGSGWGVPSILDLESGTLTPLMAPGKLGPFVISQDGKQLFLLPGPDSRKVQVLDLQ